MSVSVTSSTPTGPNPYTARVVMRMTVCTKQMKYVKYGLKKKDNIETGLYCTLMAIGQKH